MVGLLVLALVVVPLVELYVLIQVGQVIGPLPTIALLVVMSLLGAYLLRREGSRAWQAFRGATGSGRLPAREVADGALVIFGGALLLTPGFATDLLGLACVLPGSRAVLRRVLMGLVVKRLGVAGLVGGLAADRVRGRGARRGADGSGNPAAGSRPGRVVEGEVVDRDGPTGPGDRDGRQS